jgi:hypothetical protein
LVESGFLPRFVKPRLHFNDGAVKRQFDNRDVPVNLHSEVIMFKFIIPAFALAAALAAPAFAQASDNAPVTRAEVKAQLVQLERAGYNPASDQTTYPASIQAAQARVDADASSFGGSSNGASASGSASRSSGSSRIVRPAADANQVDFDRP